MKQKTKRAIRFLKRLNLPLIARLTYPNYINKLEIDPKTILLESHHGHKVDGNIYYILKELTNSDTYLEYKIYLTVAKKHIRSVEAVLKDIPQDRYQLTISHSIGYYKILASAKYLINDTSFTPLFTKKTGQVYLNTWHGTPLKAMGKNTSKGIHLIGNVQKNFLASDYLLYPNSYTRDHMVEDYMLGGLYDGKILLGGYPRNEVFYDKTAEQEIRDKLGIRNKTAIAYMPTWRALNTDSECPTIQDLLQDIDALLNKKQILYVNLHPMEASAVDFSRFKNIVPFPSDIETYATLNAMDHLITDYSSVMIDFSITKKPITLFTYDYDLYIEGRGMYVDLKEFPFTHANTTKDLIRSINQPSTYKKGDFKDFCKYDNKSATRDLCNRVILDKSSRHINEASLPKNNKTNVLIYSGNLAKNGITSSLLNLLNTVDTSKHNYYVTFMGNVVGRRRHSQIEDVVATGVKCLVLNYFPIATFQQKIILKLFEKDYISTATFLKYGGREFFDLERRRNYGDLKFSHVIQFNGYEKRNILFFRTFSEAKTHIYVHSDMLDEIQHRKNQRRDVLKYAYQNYSTVIAVTDGIKNSTQQIAEGEATLEIIPNMIPYESIIKRSNEDVVFNEDTISSKSLSSVVQILEDDTVPKYITIGRFSPEKAHSRLIKAFGVIWRKNKKSVLIIIGGPGPLHSEMMREIDTLDYRENILVIQSIKNPYPVLKKANGFILPSLYESFGIALAEADILSVPVVITDMPGPRSFMKKYGGTVVKNNYDGVVHGLTLLSEGKVPLMSANYSEYNQQAVESFEKIIT